MGNPVKLWKVGGYASRMGGFEDDDVRSRAQLKLYEKVGDI